MLVSNPNLVPYVPKAAGERARVKFTLNDKIKYIAPIEKVHEQIVFLFTFYTRVQNFSNLKAIIKSFFRKRDSLLIMFKHLYLMIVFSV